MRKPKAPVGFVPAPRAKGEYDKPLTIRIPRAIREALEAKSQEEKTTLTSVIIEQLWASIHLKEVFTWRHIDNGDYYVVAENGVYKFYVSSVNASKAEMDTIVRALNEMEGSNE